MTTHIDHSLHGKPAANPLNHAVPSLHAPLATSPGRTCKDTAPMKTATTTITALIRCTAVATAALASLCLAPAAKAQSGSALSANTAWTMPNIIEMKTASGPNAWVAPLLAKYGNQPEIPNGGLNGMSFIYRVFIVSPDIRIIAGIGAGKGCDTSDLPNSAQGRVVPMPCPLTVLTVHRDGSVNTKTGRACFMWEGHVGNTAALDPRDVPAHLNSTYFRINPQTNAVQAISVVNGKPQRQCAAEIQP